MAAALSPPDGFVLDAPAAADAPAADAPAPMLTGALNSISDPAALGAAVRAASAAGLPRDAWAPWISAVHNESGWNLNEPDGSAGEIGPGQVKPGTGADVGYSVADLRDPDLNLEASAKYFRQKWGQAGGDPAIALTAYNAGNTRAPIGQYAGKAMARLASWIDSDPPVDSASASLSPPSAGTSAPPPGFVLDAPAAAPPPGFVLDAPQHDVASTSAAPAEQDGPPVPPPTLQPAGVMPWPDNGGDPRLDPPPAAAPAPTTLPTSPNGDRPYMSGTTVRPFGGQYDPTTGADTGQFKPSGMVVPGQGQVAADANAFVQGAAGSVGSLARGVGEVVGGTMLAGETNAQAQARAQLGVMDRIDAGQAVPATDDPLGYGDMSPEQRQAMRAQYTQAIASMPAVADTTLGRAGQAAIDAGTAAAAPLDALEQASPVDKGREGMQTRLARGVGAIGPALAAGLVPGAEALVPAIIGTQSYDSTYRDQVAHGIDPATAAQAAMVNGAVQAGLMSVPLGQGIERITDALMRDGATKTALNFAAHGIAMTTASQAGRFVDNYVARATYDPDRNPLEGIDAQGVAADFALGLLVPAVHGAAGAIPGAVRALTGRSIEASDGLRNAVGGIRGETARAQGHTDDNEPAAAAPENPAPETQASAEPNSTNPPPETQTAPAAASGVDAQAAVLAEHADRQADAAAGQDVPPSRTESPESDVPPGTPAANVASLDPDAVVSFTTAKGSTYDVGADGTTTRDKAYRPEHGTDEQGPQPRSDSTVYVTSEQANALGVVQTSGGLGDKVVAPLGDGRWGVRYVDGPQAGKYWASSVVTPASEPAIGLLPVETWRDGSVHFGNPITDIQHAGDQVPLVPDTGPPAAPEPAPASRDATAAPALAARIDELESSLASLRTNSLAPEARLAAGYGVAKAARMLSGMKQAYGRMVGRAEISDLIATRGADLPFKDASTYSGDDAKVAYRAEPAMPPDLASVIKGLGGIRPGGGGIDDLRSMDFHKRPGFFNGKSRFNVEQMAEHLRDLGYLGDRQWYSTDRPEDSSALDVMMEALDHEKSGAIRWSNRFNDAVEEDSGAIRAWNDAAAEVAAEHGLSQFAARQLTRGQVVDAAAGRAAEFSLRTSETRTHLQTNEPDWSHIPPAAREARTRLADTMRAYMRFVGLPDSVGLKLMDRIADGAANGRYDPVTRSLEFALDKGGDWQTAPLKFAHEAMHAVLDQLPAHFREAIQADAQRWQGGKRFWVDKNGNTVRGTNGEYIRQLYAEQAQARGGWDTPGGRVLMRQESVAHMTEATLSDMFKPKLKVLRAIGGVGKFLSGIGRVLRGRGYRSGDDILRAILNGDTATPDARRAMEDMTPRLVPDSAWREAMGQPAANVAALESTPTDGTAAAGSAEPPPGFVVDKPAAATADGDASLLEQGAYRDRTFLSKRDPLARDTERDGQAVLPGAEASTRQVLDKRAQERLRGSKAQKDMSAFGLFDPDARKQGSLFSLRDADRQAVGEAEPAEPDDKGDFASGAKGSPADPFAIKPDGTPQYSLRDQMTRQIGKAEKARDEYTDEIRRVIVPITTGTSVAQAAAVRFANAETDIAWRFGQIDKRLVHDFSHEDRRLMWDAVDDQSLFELELREHLAQLPRADEAAAEARARAAFNGHGLDRLDARQRNAVMQLDALARDTWAKMQDRGLVNAKADGLPFYTPRFFVQVAEGKAEKVRSALGQKVSAMDPLGLNLVASAPQGRDVRITADSLRAMRNRYGGSTDLVRDIRTIPAMLAKEHRAIMGVDLVRAIKAYGDKMGLDLITATPEAGQEAQYKTIDHPALTEMQPMTRVDEATGERVVRRDEDGNIILARVPLKVHADFEGPLRSVLRGPPSKLYKGFIALKGAATRMIMISPLTHGAVIWSKALPELPGKVASFQVYFDGNRFQRDAAAVSFAISRGLRPIASSWNADVTGIYDAPNIRPGNSPFAKTLGSAGDLIDRDFGDTLRRSVDAFGHFWHQTLLWNRVRDLQFGVYDGVRKEFIAKGIDPNMAASMAAHVANRAAGVLPREAMSNAGNIMANVALFSRSYTLGNLGMMKDMFNGMPSYVRAPLEQEFSKTGVDAARSLLRRKAISAFAIDLALSYAGTSILQDLVHMITGDQSLGDVAQGYVRRLGAELTHIAHSPWDLLNPFGVVQSLQSTHDNEPGKQARISLFRDADGTMNYMRNPVGKVGEDAQGWMTAPVVTAKAKSSTILGPLIEDLANADSFGRPIRDKDAEGVSGMIDSGGRLVWHLVKPQLGLDFWESLVNTAVGGPHRTRDAMKVAGTAGGVMFSHGYPGGPEQGVEAAELRRYQAARSEAVPSARAKLEGGDEDGARQLLTNAGLTDQDVNRTIASLENPMKGQASANKRFQKIATPEAQQRLQNVSGPTPQAAAQLGASEAAKMIGADFKK